MANVAKGVASAVLLATLAGAMLPRAAAQALTIYEIQYTTDPDGTSPYHDVVVDCAGGIVIGKRSGDRPRLILQDPNSPDAWGAIQVKDWIYPYQMYQDAQIGDWISFTNMLVEDFRGTTFLQRQSAYNPTYTIVSTGNPLPPPLIVSVADIPAPLEYPDDEWYVDNHDAEPYESMRLIVRDVTVTAMDLGKAIDNYNLKNALGDDCWAADYMNPDAYPPPYHPFVALDQHFCAVAGVLEQYTNLPNGWDYYQLLTLGTVDLAICGDGNSDGVFNADDLPRLADCLIGPQCAAGGCNPPAWTWDPPAWTVQHCLMMDPDYDGDVDLGDVATLQAMFDPS